jgi:hypothetical protein
MSNLKYPIYQVLYAFFLTQHPLPSALPLAINRWQAPDVGKQVMSQRSPLCRQNQQ